MKIYVYSKKKMYIYIYISFLIIEIRTVREPSLRGNMMIFVSFQVAWMLFDKSAILTVQNHVITRNPRISVSHDKHRTWFLHINDVHEEDKGKYMCQINTAAAKTQYGYLHVVGKAIVVRYIGLGARRQKIARFYSIFL